MERFSAEQFQHSRGAFWTSSLRGAVPITAVDNVRLPASDQVVNMINTELGIG
jgi:branched-subunit amino acid aminotransferase/4-amino-4-deoxychorismate lyase